MDRNFQGPCDLCCDPCALFLANHKTLTLLLSGLTICPCIALTPNGGTAQTGYTSWDGSYVLNQSGSVYTWQGASYDFHEDAWNGGSPGCAGSISGSADFKRVITASVACPSGVITVTANTNGGGRYFLGTGSIFSISTPIINSYSNPSCTGVRGSAANFGADGGVVTVSV